MTTMTTMTTMRSVVRVARHPVVGAWHAAGRVRPDVVWSRYEARCREAGLEGPAFVLSLDCDTLKDIEVAPDVHGQLAEIGIRPVYAVPGELLERGAATYGPIAASGSEFLNHGDAEHTRLEDGRYHSFFFYDRLPFAVVERDVERGHRSVETVTGRPPVGFRTPHFGSFQSPAQLRALHALLGRLGYRYSTSTSPAQGVRYGPASDRWGLPEVPVSGCPTWPLGILDSFGFRFASGRIVGEAEFVREASTLADWLDGGRPILVNLYVDPSQVHDWPAFFDAMKRFAPYALESYGALLDRLGR